MHDTSKFSNNCLQTDYFTYNSLYHNSSGSQVYIHQVPKIPENYVMVLEASDRLIDTMWVNWRWTSGWFQGLPSNSVPLCLTSWENQKKSAKTPEKLFVDLHKSGSSLGAISKLLKVPRSSVQTIYTSINTMGPRSRHTAQEGDMFSLWDERTLVRKVQINPRTTAKCHALTIESPCFSMV